MIASYSEIADAEEIPTQLRNVTDRPFDAIAFVVNAPRSSPIKVAGSGFILPLKQPLSIVREPFERYSSSGEINTQVDDAAAVIERVRAEFATFPSDEIDGLTVDCGDWWFNLRPSNTEPLLRLNLEAADRNACDDRVTQLLALITA